MLCFLQLIEPSSTACRGQYARSGKPSRNPLPCRSPLFPLPPVATIFRETLGTRSQMKPRGVVRREAVFGHSLEFFLRRASSPCGVRVRFQEVVFQEIQL